MIEEHASTVSAPVFKAATAWTAVGIATWADAAAFMQFVASFVAAIYSAILIGEWLWKKGGREYAVKRGWVKPKAHKTKGGKSADKIEYL